MCATATQSLLTPFDPPPVELVHGESDAPLVLVCEHAGRAIPSKLGSLGVSGAALNSHRGWDIGAEAVARMLATLLRAPLVLQRYSRLVIDANRPPGAETSIPEISDGVAIPGNRGLSDAEKERRVDEIFKPMDRTISDAFDACPRRGAFSIHSYTPRLNGVDRPWHAGFLSRKSLPTAERLMASVNRAAPGLRLALNEPYRIEDDTDWFIPVHCEPRELPHCLIEIRNNEIEQIEGACRWADHLAGAIRYVLRNLP